MVRVCASVRSLIKIVRNCSAHIERRAGVRRLCDRQTDRDTTRVA